MSRRAHILDFDAVRARNASLGSGRVSARGSAREAAAARAARRREQTGFGWAALRRDPASAWEQAGYGYDSYDPDAADDWREDEEEPAAETTRSTQRNGRSKKRAERAYRRAIDNSAPADDGGPRAAFYKMKMGKGHKRAASRAGSATGASRRGGLSLPGLSALSGLVEHLPKSLALKVAGGVAVCLVAMALFLYPAAQNYYVAKRDLAKTEAAFQVVQERNALLEKDVAALQTKEGIEDRVREEYGWVKPGENAVVVTGREGSGKEFHADDLPTVDAVKAPQTWYSDVLDPFFGYQG